MGVRRRPRSWPSRRRLVAAQGVAWLVLAAFFAVDAVAGSTPNPLAVAGVVGAAVAAFATVAGWAMARRS